MKIKPAIVASALLALLFAAPTIAAAAPPATPGASNEPFIGNPNAPLTLYYWHDFQCPTCRAFDTQTLPSIVASYVKTGKLRIVFKDLILFGPDSVTAAELARAVWTVAPQRFYDWQHTVYLRQGPERSGWANRAHLVAITGSVAGIPVSKVTAVLDRNAADYRAVVTADQAEARQFGIRGTPGFWIDGQAFSGAQPFAFFQQILNADLK